MPEWQEPASEDLSGLLLKLKVAGFMSGVTAYGTICRWGKHKTVLLLLYGSASVLRFELCECDKGTWLSDPTLEGKVSKIKKKT